MTPRRREKNIPQSATPSLGTRQLLKTGKQDRRYSEGFLLRTKTTPPRIRQQGERHGTEPLGGFKPLPYREVVNSSKSQHEKTTTGLTSPKSSVSVLIFYKDYLDMWSTFLAVHRNSNIEMKHATSNSLGASCHHFTGGS